MNAAIQQEGRERGGRHGVHGDPLHRGGIDHGQARVHLAQRLPGDREEAQRIGSHVKDGCHGHGGIGLIGLSGDEGEVNQRSRIIHQRLETHVPGHPNDLPRRVGRVLVAALVPDTAPQDGGLVGPEGPGQRLAHHHGAYAVSSFFPGELPSLQ